MRYGYFLASTKECYGDPYFSALAQKYWEHSGLTVPGRFDGVSAWGDGDQPTTVRVVARDMFSMASTRYAPADPFEINKYVMYDVPLRNTEDGQ